MLAPEVIHDSLMLASVFIVTLGTLIGYIIDSWKGAALFAIVTSSSFWLLIHYNNRGAGAFTLLLIMLFIGLQGAYSFYYLANSKIPLFLTALLTPLPSLFILLRIANRIETGGTLFLNLSLLALLIYGWRMGHETWRQDQGAKAVLLCWYGFSLLFEIGHHLAGPIGILALTIPVTFLFWSLLLILARWYLLPILPPIEIYSQEEEDTTLNQFQFIRLRLRQIWQLLWAGDAEQSTAEREARAAQIENCLADCWQISCSVFPLHNLAMKSILTFILGTNYPYITIEDRDITTQVPGDRFKSILSGPGIILTPPDQTVAIWNGISFKGVPEPGLIFTDAFESIQEKLDLRPQLRAFTVQAKTKDGIRVSVLTFVPHRLDPRKQVEDDIQPQLGEAYPFNQQNIFKTIHREAVNYRREGSGRQQVEFREKSGWDTIVPHKAQEILINVLADYNFDELCAPFERKRDPRTEIKERFLEELKEEIETDTLSGPLPEEAWGIQIVGGGISNILPPEAEAWQQDTVWRARIDNWRITWASRTISALADGKAAALRDLQKARLDSHYQLIDRLTRKLTQLNTPSREALSDAVTWYFADTMEEIIGDPLSQNALPEHTIETLNQIKETVGKKSKNRSELTGDTTS